MSVSKDINSLIKIKKIKAGLPTLTAQNGIASVKGEGNTTEAQGSGILNPLDLVVYLNSTPVETIIATNGTFNFFEAEYAEANDPNGDVAINFQTVTYVMLP